MDHIPPQSMRPRNVNRPYHRERLTGRARQLVRHHIKRLGADPKVRDPRIVGLYKAVLGHAVERGHSRANASDVRAALGPDPALGAMA